MKNLLFGIYFLVALVACNKQPTAQETQQNNAPANQQETQPKSTETAQTTALLLTINRNGGVFATIESENDKAVIRYENQTIWVHRRKDDKRKAESNGTIIAEIKYKEEGFKLRTAEGNLKWKVKINAEKVKISDNEENNNPFEIKIDKDKNTAKVKRNETEIAKATLQNNQLKITANNLTFEFGVAPHQAEQALYAAVLGIETIAVQDRLLLLVELLKIE